MTFEFDATMVAFSKYVLTTLILTVPAKGKSSSRYQDEGLYSQSGKATWMYETTGLSFEYLGCAWAYTEDNEDYGCREDGSEDGTSYWYQMANCRRAQVAYNVYSTSSSYQSSCSTSDFVESFHSTNGLIGWVTLLGTYDSYSPISYDDVGGLPNCEQGDSGYYEMVGCSEKGTFQIDMFEDSYCMKPIGVADSLSSINKKLSKLNSCNQCFDGSSGYDASSSCCGYLIAYSESCSSLDNQICGDPDGSKSATYSYAGRTNNMPSFAKMSGVGNNFKYVFGSLFLVSSFIMFLGILMMNRRKRRANLNRKFRQSTSRRRRGEGKSRSRSRRGESRGDGRREGRSSNRRSKSRDRRSSSRKRSSRSRSAAGNEEVPADSGVYT